ncbi:MAG TPA: Cj0069 family protein [Hyphomonadaceae bacterium]|nr:Cj0069 family protein [Hyphomonadaceae bacterium]
MDHNPSLYPRVVIIWRGSDSDRAQSARYEGRLAPVIEALRRRGLSPDPVVYFDREAEALRRRLHGAAGALVWVNPLAEGQTRATLNALLREAAQAGVFVSAHPDVIDAMGTKRVLFDTRMLSWSADIDLYEDMEGLVRRLPRKLAAGEARVLKPLRGNDGQGVLKLQLMTDGRVRLQRAADDLVEFHDLHDLPERLAPLFVHGAVIDQSFNDNAAAGMVRCYMVQNRVAGFAVQQPRIEGANAFAMQSAKAMHGPDAPDLQDLRMSMEEEWTPGLQRLLAIETQSLPVLWDADFLLRPMGATSSSRFVLCEINVSCVSPFPATVPDMLSEAAARAISGAGRTVAGEGNRA